MLLYSIIDQGRLHLAKDTDYVGSIDSYNNLTDICQLLLDFGANRHYGEEVTFEAKHHREWVQEWCIPRYSSGHSSFQDKAYSDWEASFI